MVNSKHVTKKHGGISRVLIGRKLEYIAQHYLKIIVNNTQQWVWEVDTHWDNHTHNIVKKREVACYTIIIPAMDYLLTLSNLPQF